ncbi:small multi-drug export protein [Methanoculleus sp. FWC-SCC3]|uniref:Small multi-drug export protein n=1 Tax=Methanoculleus methanifontis TaxID=2584086 RepID=A0ABT8M3I6_9EURY|nr:small multi-drug export protein [Methanoculleus sp. FWC-SCC3]MDN7013171.1 small multi-drug export protein [Methanoculleus sp. FWC-SCC3]
MRQIEMWGDDDDTTSWLKVTVPFLLCGIFLVVVWFFLPAEQWLLLFGMMVAYIVPPLGRETIIPVCILCGVPWWLAAFALAFLDFVGGLFMAWNFPLVLRIPYIGSWISRFVEAGRTFLDRRPWLERLYFVGLVAFLALPFDGSGSIVGSVIGRMLGMTKTEVISCIAIGGFIGSFAIALGIDYVVNLIPAGAGFWVSLAVFLLIGTALLVTYRNYSQRAETDA